MLESILDAMDKAGERLTGVERDAIGEVAAGELCPDRNQKAA
jgi:hypothetical protein